MKNHEDLIIEIALQILSTRLHKASDPMNSKRDVISMLRLKMAALESECVVVMFFNVRMGLIASDTMFKGGLTETSLHAREIIKAALNHNAAAVLVAHNHPSGDPEPSLQDARVTELLQAACDLFDIHFLDHVIIGNMAYFSFSESGQL